MNVTLYAICKNEEKNVEKFIENSKKFSHTVVVDTGSTDNTVQLLRDAGITVYEHPQSREEFDFSVARNQALSYVETDWAFSLDFNEDVGEFNTEGLDVIEGEFTRFQHQRYDKVEDNEPTQSNTAHTRFHRTKNYTWVYSVHEQPSFIPTESHPEEVSVETSFKITKNIHQTVDKELFYLSICEREYAKNPMNSYYIWFLFKHYFSVRSLEKSLNYGQEYLNNSQSYSDPNRIDVFIVCSNILLELKDFERAANYAFHAISEALNFKGSYLENALMNLLNIGKVLDNPNIIIFATSFSSEALKIEERSQSINKLFEMNNTSNNS